jgi:YVTN family beta-propeller protein
MPRISKKVIITGVVIVAMLILLISLLFFIRIKKEKPLVEREEIIEEILLPGKMPDNRTLLPMGWAISPAGEQINVGDLPLGMALSPDGRYLAVTNNGWSEHYVSIIDTESLLVIQELSLTCSFYGITFSQDGKKLYVSGGGANEIEVFDFKEGKFFKSNPIDLGKGIIQIPLPGFDIFPAGLALSLDGKKLYVAENLGNYLDIVNLSTGKVKKVRIGFGLLLPRGLYPYDIVVSNDGSKIYVSDWGQRKVSVVDAEKEKFIRCIEAEGHPNDMILSPDGRFLYVANAISDSISVICTQTDEVTETISVQPYPGAPFGSTPNALAISPDGRRLYVANADNNDVVVIELSGDGRGKLAGLIPVGWYPTALSFSPDGRKLYVANGKGLASKPNPRGPHPYRKSTAETQYIGRLLFGTVSVIDTPDREKLARYTIQVEKNNNFNELRKEKIFGNLTHKNPIPRHLGEPSPIKHVIYIIKENRAYDQILGDLPQGEGDPALCLFNRTVTPNHHALAEEFVLLDNFYVNGEVSMDGHEWSMGAIATDFVEKSWPTQYSGKGKGPLILSSGALNPVSRPDNGYLFDAAARVGISYRIYGEWTYFGLSLFKNLWGHADPLYIGWNLDYPDVKRAEEFIRDFNQLSKANNLPNLMILWLPNDHTYGTTPGKHTPRAMVADNDLALGMIVDAVSHSKYWNETAIFVLEDDAQDGPDHIDCHRSPAFVISPWVKRGEADHTMYDTVSMLKTIELILGLPPMSQYDAVAVPMVNCFNDSLDPTPYNCHPNLWPLAVKNPPDAYGAEECLEMDFRMEDQIPWVRLNEIIWKSIKGADSEMPPPINLSGG